MILIHGKMIDSTVENIYTDHLYEDCIKTLNGPHTLTTSMVIDACDVLYQQVISGVYDEMAKPLLERANISQQRFMEMAKLFSKEELEYKCKVELGEDYEKLSALKSDTKRKICPQGILFHIAAGNVDGLPAYSVIEGLLVGNINILKLPGSDNGFSVALLSELIKVEPLLKDYIYVFDVPSIETVTLKKFVDIADCVVVWGGDEAVEATKHMTDTKTKVVSWGHKLSFAYVTENATDNQLFDLAKHICETNQVLCSSCQGIFLDLAPGEDKQLYEFAEYFFKMMKEANRQVGKTDIGMRGKNTIRLYNDRLEAKSGIKIYNEEGVSVMVKNDSELELSYLFRNVWIKALPRKSIVQNLKKHKGHLQTCGLICGEDERMDLADLLAKAGLLRITKGNMSRMYVGEAHDGCYPLREYSRIVEID